MRRANGTRARPTARAPHRATWTYAAGARRFARGAELPVISPDVSVGCYERLAGDVVRALKGAFYGPPKGGHYSPGVQATLYEMGAAALAATPALANITLAMPNLHFNPCRIGAPVSVVFEVSRRARLAPRPAARPCSRGREHPAARERTAARETVPDGPLTAGARPCFPLPAGRHLRPGPRAAWHDPGDRAEA